MAVRTTFVQDGAYNAPDFRFAQGVPVVRNLSGAVATGLIDIGVVGTLVVPGGANNVSVGVFLAQLPDSGAGAYVGGNDASAIIPILTPETSNNRTDVLCWRPLEGLATTSTGASTKAHVTLAGSGSLLSKQVIHGELYFVKGTPSASTSPTVPSTPAGSIALARVYVAGGSTTVASANITQVATFVSTQVGDGSIYVPAMRSLGTGATQAAAGNHQHGATVQSLAEFNSTPNTYWPTNTISGMFGYSGPLASVTAPAAGEMEFVCSMACYAGGNAAGTLRFDLASNQGATVSRTLAVHTNGTAMGFTRTSILKRAVVAGEVITWGVSGAYQAAGVAITTKMFDAQVWFTTTKN